MILLNLQTFDPSDSPAEKEREAASAKAKLAPIARLKKQSATGGARGASLVRLFSGYPHRLDHPLIVLSYRFAEVSIDTGVGAPTPTVTLSPAGEPIKTTVLNGTSIASGDIPTEAEESPKGEPVGAQGVPGAIPAQPTEGLPDWVRRRSSQHRSAMSRRSFGRGLTAPAYLLSIGIAWMSSTV